MPGLEQETTGCIYGITSDFEVAKIWVKSCGSVMTLEDQARGMNVVEAPNQDKLVPHASQPFLPTLKSSSLSPRSQRTSSES